ncbi:phospho-sugar mutase [Myxococcota bacterium]|nr:phospho-sugar mutase [Myxococcota bacterium]
MDALLERARAWIIDDPDPDTRATVAAWIAAEDRAALEAHFGAQLEFGTAGMRGEIGPGPNRMNRANVRRVSLALAHHALAEIPSAAARGVVIGFDGRTLSAEMAQDTARVFAGLGFKVWLFDEMAPTPRLAHALLHLGCAVGVMVTASHNPPRDNGYKVYWADGAQILPEQADGISARRDQIGGLSGVALPALAALRAEGQLRAVDEAVFEAYLEGLAGLRVYDGPTTLRVAYTPMHGVGLDSLTRVLSRFGYTDLHVVPAQAQPDPAFPTVAFPNPEEPGAMDLVEALGRAIGADLVVANDPDADRLAIAIPDGAGGFLRLTGDQIGALLGDELLRYGPAGGEPLLVTTVVSSIMFKAIAAAHGATYAETLTGFKWLAHRVIDHPGRPVLAYEEALGYAPGALVRDKDGLSAALLFCDLAARCAARGETLLGRLEGLYRQHGLHLSAQVSVRGDQATLSAIMARIRAAPPKAIGARAVISLRDLQTGLHHQGARVEAISLPKTNALIFTLDDKAVIRVRPSGTEPKVKLYFEWVGVLGAAQGYLEGVAAARPALTRLIEETRAALGL